MDVEKIAGNSDEARMIVNTILNTEEDATAILECLENTGMVGDRLTTYFEDYYADTSPTFEVDVHNFAVSVLKSTRNHTL